MSDRAAVPRVPVVTETDGKGAVVTQGDAAVGFGDHRGLPGAEK
jgi:hypothetical protein